jgi:hypothetical protein
MTSMITGLPDRYRPLDEVGPEEITPTGVIRCWRAKDRVLNRDVAIRVHTPGGPPAHAWIARALTAGGLATPALAMVYDAAEGGPADAGEQAAYVVNEWIEGETLADRLARGPMPEREVRTVMRRLADGVAEAHRAGLALGGLTPDRVVLRPNGLVGVRAVPAATGTLQGDITALGALLEACLTGRPNGGGRITQPDLAALVRRALSTEPGQSLSSAAAMAALLAERPRSRPAGPEPGSGDDADAGWLRRLRERRGDPESQVLPPAQGPQATRVLDRGPEPAVPAPPAAAAAPSEPPATMADTPPTRTLPAPDLAVPPPSGPAHPVFPSVPPARRVPGPPTGDRFRDESEDDELIKSEVFGAATPAGATFHVGELAQDPYTEDAQFTEDDVSPAQIRQRRRLLTIGMPILALAVIIGLAWWLGSNVLSVAGSVDDVRSTSPAASASASSSGPQAGQPVAIQSAAVYDPFGDGQPENDNEVPQSFDGNPTTAWNTLQYRAAALGNLKPGVGVLYDLGSPQALASATITTSLPGATMEIRVGDQSRGSLDSYQVAGSATVTGTTDIRFAKPVTGRYVLVWITKLPAVPAGFQANVAELVLHSAR